MHFGKPPRPAPFPPGTPIGEHFQVENLVRLAEGRMFYLLTDERDDRPTRRCWNCGTENPRSATSCQTCNATLEGQRFLMSTRWDPERFRLVQRVYRDLPEHPGYVRPIEVLVEHGVLCSIVPYDGQSLLLDESAPLPFSVFLDLFQRGVGLLAFLAQHGVALDRLTPANFLLDRSRRPLLYDIEPRGLHPELSAEDRRHNLQALGTLLRRYAPIDFTEAWELLSRLQEGAWSDTSELGKAFIELYQHGTEHPPPEHPASAISDVGLVRELNEDNWGWTRLAEGVYLYVVADGMGGHDAGEVASELATRTLCEEAQKRTARLPELSAEALENVLDEAFQKANNTVKESAESRHNDMGTTLVAMLVVRGSQAIIANVGDSRAYLLRGDVLHRLTHDHSLVQRMVDQKRITEAEARNHPHSNILLRTVGTERNVEIDIRTIELDKGDRILLCSDGLWGEVEDREIGAILGRYADLRYTSRELVRAAHRGGGRDNVTCLLVEAR